MGFKQFDDDKKFEYHVNKDRVFDEKGSTFLALREIAWGCSQEEEPKEGKVHLELRRWRIRDEKEMPDKGFSFLTEVYNNFPNQFSTGQIGVNALILTASKIDKVCMQTTKHYIKFSKLTDKVYDYISEHCEIASNPILNGKRRMLNCEVRQILNRWPCS